MQTPDYNSPAVLKSVLEAHGFSMQKKFGQNFLLNAAMRTRLVDALNIESGMNVWEIGPGLGSMTKLLLEKGAAVTAFEIDRGFIQLLENFFADEIAARTLALVSGDVLKTWRAVLHENEAHMPARFFGNLPYNIAATLIADTIERGMRFDKAVVTVQKEVGSRMCAKADTSDYSSFTILCQWAYDVKMLFDIGAGNFWPRPHVASCAVSLVKKADFPRCNNPALFLKMVRALFASRRKNIRNNLTAFLGDSEKALHALECVGISPASRAETLPIATLLQLSDALNAAIINV